jgi:hypothetical protein
MKRIRRYLGRHFSRLERLGKWSFLWRSWLEAVVIAYAIGEILQGVFPAGPRTDLQGLPLVQLVALVAVIGPLFETVVFQCLPLELTAALGFRRAARLIISIVPFALMHQFAGVPTVVAAGIVGGFYFAFTYERWRKESLVAGVLMTFLLHSSYNLVGVLGMLILHK